MSDSVSTVERIEIFSRWMGFASPPSAAEKVIVTRGEDGFRREWLPEGEVDQLPADRIAELLAALALPPVPELDPSLMDFPEEAVRSHYSSMWTDDDPSFIAKIAFADGRVISVQSHAQHAYMLPLIVFERHEDHGYATYDPRLSRAIAALMPEGFLGKERLSGQSGMLALDLDAEAAADEMPREPDEPPPNESDADETPAGAAKADRDPDAEFDEIVGFLFGDESPEEKETAERTGRISERLLKNISAGDVRDLLARGADPNIADELGQTALMQAAWPPLDRERFRLLAAAGAAVDARRDDGLTGLHLAASGWMTDAAEEWLRAGADVNARTPEGSTPLMLGAPSAAVVRRLLTAGAGPNLVDDDGHTALVYAIIWQSRHREKEAIEVVRTLIAAGTDLNLRDRKGLTALGHARRELSRALVAQEAFYAFTPNVLTRVPESNRFGSEACRLAEAIITLITESGGRD